MSHFTEIESQIRDLEALRDACIELGLELAYDTEARGFVGQTRKGEAVIKLKGPYDIALNQQPDGTYALTTDWWNGYVEKEVGASYSTLFQLYGVHNAQREARRKGYLTTRKTLPNGAIKLTIGGV